MLRRQGIELLLLSSSLARFWTFFHPRRVFRAAAMVRGERDGRLGSSARRRKRMPPTAGRIFAIVFGDLDWRNERLLFSTAFPVSPYLFMWTERSCLRMEIELPVAEWQTHHEFLRKFGDQKTRETRTDT
jgi:hypothetical protein